MNCIKCGGQLLETARFCPACGTPVGGASRPQIRARLLVIGGVAALVAVAIIVALLFLNRAPPTAASPAAAPSAAVPQAPVADSARITASQVTGFDWSGLSPEQLQAARAALDQAIAREEQGRTAKSGAAVLTTGKTAP